MVNRFYFLLILFISTFLMVNAQSTTKVRQLAYADSARLAQIFIDLHKNPELAFMEVRTSGIITKELKSIGYEVISGIAKTGVVGILKNGSGPVVMFRADMDCNAVKEVSGLSYASTKTMANADGLEVPVMHACGHDAHVTWMLGIAKIMMTLKNEWKGTLVLLAQPAEEVGAGAKAMLADNLYERGIPVPDYLFGMHTRPIAVGSIENGISDRMAGTDQLDVTFFGIGGHGATPEFTKDPIIMASNAVLQYQTIISRNKGAQDVAVITVGAFQSGNSNNVIPASAVLKVNLRWFNEGTRNLLLEKIKNINDGIAVANNLPKEMYPKINIKATAYPLVNEKKMTEKINVSMNEILGQNNVITNTPALMISEDFHHLVLGNKKSVYDFMFVGTANPDVVAESKKNGIEYPFYNHNGNYVVDLSAIPLGTQIGATALLEMFRK